MKDAQAKSLLERQDFDDVTVLRVKVPLLHADTTTENLFRQAYSFVEDAGRFRLVLNLAAVIFLSSMALGKVVRLTQKARKSGGRLVLCQPRQTVEEIFRVSQLAEILPIYADEQEAIRSFKS
jgi:anti-anti-sigma factor